MDQPKTHYAALLRDYVWPQRRRMAALAAALLSAIALQIANPQVLRYFIDTAQAAAPTSRLIVAALIFLCGALLNQAATVAATYVSELVGWTATNQLRTQLLEHTLHLDRSFHASRTPGELIERIDGDVAALANFFSQFVIQVVGNLVLFVGVIVVIGLTDGLDRAGAGGDLDGNVCDPAVAPARGRAAAPRRPPGQRRAVRVYRGALGRHRGSAIQWRGAVHDAAALPANAPASPA